MGDLELQIFSDRLRELRLKRNLTQKDFAEKIGVTAAALSAYENNLKNPSVAVAKRIAESFDVSLDWLCGLTEIENYNEDIETYADLIRLLVKLSNIECSLCAWDVLYEDNSYIDDMSRTGINYAILRNSDKTIVHFFKDWEQMRGLYIAGTIDKHLYDLWLSDRINQYEDFPLVPSIDAELPFD